jgi:hypothetical protein
LAKWQVDKTAVGQYGKLTERQNWQVGKVANWQNGKLAKRQDTKLPVDSMVS